MQTQDSTVLITGASSGLGLACTERWLQRGGRVLGLDLAPAPPSSGSQPSDRYCHIQADVTDSDAVQSALARAAQQLGPIRGAICCAGILHGERVIGRDGPASLDAFRRVLDVNVVGTFNVVRLVADAIAHQPTDDSDASASSDRGVIVMTASIAAFEGQIGQSAYSASKGAIAAMTLPMARELARHSIRVVSIAPGVFETPMMQSASDKVRQPLLDMAVFPKRFGLPEEFASLVEHVFENPMLNGTVMRLDGALRM